MLAEHKPFAEVIECSLQGFLAQSWDSDKTPAFGSLVTLSTNKRTLFGVVHQIETGSIDPTRHPFAYQKTEEELRKEQPQIFEFLKTTFASLVVGYKNSQGKIRYLLAPEPVKIHAFVSSCDPVLSRQFFKSTLYLHGLFGLAHTVVNLDELLLAILANQASQGILTQTHLRAFTSTFSLLTGNDYRRLKLFLQRVEPLLESSAMPKN